MLILCPNGIRALILNDDARFLTSCSVMLSILNFKAATCRSPTSALRLLTRGKLKDVDVILTDAAKAAACGFDFRGIVEADLCIPVIYFLSLDHRATGDEADNLLRMLRAATYTIRKPLDADDLCRLWRVIAWRKCYLEVKANQAGRNGVVPAAAVEALMAGSTIDEEREDEEHIHFKVVRAGGRGRKRKRTSNPGGSSSTTVAGDHDATRQQQMNVKGWQERDNVASQQQPAPQDRRGMEAKKNDGKVPKFQQPQAMDGRHSGQQQQQKPLFVLPALQTLNAPPYKHRIFADATGLSSNVAACTCAGNTAASPPALAPPVYPVPAPAPQPVYSAPVPTPALPSAPAPCPVYSAPAPPAINPTPAPALPLVYPARPSRVYSAPILQPPVYQAPARAPALPPVNPARALSPVHPVPAPTPSRVYPAPVLQPLVYQAPALPLVHQQQQPAARNVFGAAIAPSATTVTREPQFSQQQQQQGVCPPLMFGSFSFQSPRPPVVQQDMFMSRRRGSGMRRREAGSIMISFKQLPAGDLFTGMASGGVTFGASAAATAHAGVYGNAASSRLQSLNLGTDDHDELSATVTTYAGSNSPVAPQHVSVASNEAAIAALYNDNYCARSLMAPQHIGHGVAANEAVAMETLNSDSYINYSIVPAMAPQQVDHGVVPDEGAGMEEALNSDNFSNYRTGSLMAPDQVLGMASNVNELTTAGGAFGGNVASFTTPQNLVAAPNGNQLAPGALDDINGLLMGSEGPGTAMDGNAVFEAMYSADQYEENDMFPLEDLLGLDSPINDAGLELDGQQGGVTGGTATTADAAGTSLIGGERGMGIRDIKAADNLENLDDFFVNGTGDFMSPYVVNNGRK